VQSPPRFPSFFRTLWHCLNRAMRRHEDRCRLLMGVANRPAREEIPMVLNDAHSYGQHSQVAIRGFSVFTWLGLPRSPLDFSLRVGVNTS
jgi:hypothetical protein